MVILNVSAAGKFMYVFGSPEPGPILSVTARVPVIVVALFSKIAPVGNWQLEMH